MGTQEYSRAERVAGQVRRELAEILALESNDPRFARVTISAAEMSKDLSHATVYVTPRQGANVALTLNALNGAAGFLRRSLGRRIQLRSLPTLRFVYDPTLDNALKVSALIDNAIASKPRVPDADGEC